MSEHGILTQVEHEFMEILWDLGEGSVHDILDRLPEQRPLAYTSVSTILRILQQKNVLDARKVGRKHIYKPLLTRERYKERSLDKLLRHVFGGNPLALVQELLGKFEVEEDALERIAEEIHCRQKEHLPESA